MNEQMYPFNQQRREDTAPVEHEDQGKWELDTEPWLDIIYHGLIGESLDKSTGVWVRDKNQRPTMTKQGAEVFISSLKNRVNIHMQFSELDGQEIREIASITAENYAELMEDNWPEWEILSAESNLTMLGWQMYHNLFISLNIAKKGGMKTHRERSKVPMMIHRQQHEGDVI